MKNKLLLDYTISERFLDLVGIKREEIYDFRDSLIYFNRNNKKYLIQIRNNYYEKEEDAIHLEMLESIEHFTFGYGISLFQVRNIKCDEDFRKFRELTELYFKPKVIIDCNKSK